MVQSAASPAPVPLEPPPTFGRQMAQLVIIPAVIAIIAIALFWLFGSLAATPDSLSDQLTRLKQSSGYGGNLIAGAQDPRYKDRCQAAFQIATLIEKIEADSERQSLSKELVTILKERVHEDDQELQYFMVMAIGRLAQPGGFEAVTARADSKHAQIRIGVVGAILSWADRDLTTARGALPLIAKLLTDSHEQVRTLAAAAAWRVLTPEDSLETSLLVQPLREAMASVGVDPNGRNFQATVTHAAIALASMGDEQGSSHVANVLLNREALAKQRADSTNQSDALMNANEQDHVIASTLHYVSKMKDERIWNKVKELAANDPSISIRKAAVQLIKER